MKWKLPEKNYIKEAELMLGKAKKFRRKYSKKWERPEVFCIALKEYERLLEEADYGFYLSLAQSVDMGSPKLKKISSVVSGISMKISDHLRFFSEGVPRMEKEKQKAVLGRCSNYGNYLKQEFASGKYLLPEEAEKVSERLSRPSWSNWERMVSEFTSSDSESGKPLPVLLSETHLKNRKKRERAVKLANKILERHSREAEYELNSILEAKQRMDELRGYKYPEEPRFLSDQITASMVDEIMEVVIGNMKLSRKFYEWKAENLGGMKYSWRAVPVEEMGKISEKEMFERVGKIFSEAGFPEHMKYFLDGRLDLYPGKGKRGGAFCASHSPSADIYILMNFTGKMDDAFTLAHEMGHGLHDKLMRKQSYLNYGSPLPLAETASTFFENLFGEKSQGRGIKEHLAQSDISTVFRQAAAFMFEKELHRKFQKAGWLSRDEITGIMDKWMKKYMGDVDMDMPYFWVAWSHFRTPFYVYSYVFGQLLALSLLSKYLKTGDFRPVRKILEAGSSVPPAKLVPKKFWRQGMKMVKERVKRVVK